MDVTSPSHRISLNPTIKLNTIILKEKIIKKKIKKKGSLVLFAVGVVLCLPLYLKVQNEVL